MNTTTTLLGDTELLRAKHPAKASATKGEKLRAQRDTKSSANRQSSTGQVVKPQRSQGRYHLITMLGHMILQGCLVNADELIQRNANLLNGGKDEYGKLAKHLSNSNHKVCIFSLPMHPDSPISTGHFFVHSNLNDGMTIIGLMDESDE